MLGIDMMTAYLGKSLWTYKAVSMNPSCIHGCKMQCVLVTSGGVITHPEQDNSQMGSESMMADQKHRDQSRKTEGSHLEPQQEAERKWKECVVWLLNLQPAPPTTSFLQQGRTS